MVRLISMAVLMSVIPATAAAATLLVDPTQPPSGFAGKPATTGLTKSEGKQLQLQQILLTGDQAVAIINNRIVRTGDKFQGYTVKAISEKRVRLQSSRQTLNLRMFPEQIKD